MIKNSYKINQIVLYNSVLLKRYCSLLKLYCVLIQSAPICSNGTAYLLVKIYRIFYFLSKLLTFAQTVLDLFMKCSNGIDNCSNGIDTSSINIFIRTHDHARVFINCFP